jgi:hypothetical protein
MEISLPAGPAAGRPGVKIIIGLEQGSAQCSRFAAMHKNSRAIKRGFFGQCAQKMVTTR